MKVYISADYFYAYRLADSEETVGLFGEDFLEEFGIVLEDNLLYHKYKSVMKEYTEIQKQLEKLIERK